jgi:hypothetical protein
MVLTARIIGLPVGLLPSRLAPGRSLVEQKLSAQTLDRVYESGHPLIQHKLTILRQTNLHGAKATEKQLAKTKPF